MTEHSRPDHSAADSNRQRKILVTSALPYANGAIHLGHLVEYIQTDIWVRFQRMRGHQVVYVCADDTHGTPIMLRAEKEGLSPEALIDRVWHEHTRDFAGFAVSFDQYYSTHSAENKELSERVYQGLKDAGLIEIRRIEQMYDPTKEMFLPDRFIKGDCPKCGAKDQYGDSCEACGATYSPTELNNPRSVVSGSTPIRKESDHHFFKLSDPRCFAFLRQWAITDERLQPEAANKLKEWLGESASDSAGLSDWDISRDAPYFGFEIPGAPGKYFYVWLDAPVGYYASLKKYCDDHGLSFASFTAPDSEVEQYHFIGKDILYFHTLFWPAMLKFSGFRTPTNVFAHGFLTVDGAKMSKSRGTFITAQSYLDQALNPEWLRYYFAAKLNGSMEDLDLNLSDFIAKINSDLVGKYVNIASRCAGFITKRFGGQLDPGTLAQTGHVLNQAITAAQPDIAAAYEQRDTARVVREAGVLMDLVNSYVDSEKPWEVAKQSSADPTLLPRLHEICSRALKAFAQLTILLKPILPLTAQRIEQEVFGLPRPLSWSDLATPPIHDIKGFSHLMTRVDRERIDALIAANRESLG
ncbi:MAG: methionine--tRNA ligase [Betaproteobacteria bacterium]|nr:methionine--tRNA ligase [Betaproteobacteria bacterium]